MSISMIGIDHNMAPVDIRAKFAFTKKNAGEAMEKIKNENGIYGCVILSTCNRLEVWASVDDEEDVCLNPLSCCGSHSEQNLQNTICRKILSCQIQGILHLCKDLILPYDL